MIYTSSYEKFKTNKYRLVSISKDKGASYIDENGKSYEGECYLSLAPKREFFKKWRVLRNEVSFEESTMFYMRHFYHEVLKNLDPNKVYNDLDNSVLLCYEQSYEFCHRHIVAAWLEKNLGVKVVECEFTDDKIIERKRPDYIDEYLNMVMNEDLSKKMFEK